MSVQSDSPPTCRVATVSRYTGNPADFDVTEQPRPKLATETQVEIQVHAASLNPIDYKRAEGMLSIALPEKFPLRLGYDLAGTVLRVGSEVKRFKQGDRVYGRVHSEHAGAIAEVAVAEEAVLARIPDSVSFNVAASVPLAGLTALQSLEAAGLKSGQTVFVTGGMGGVGMFAVALSKLHFKAAEVITTVSTAKVERVREMGAMRVVDYTKEDYTAVLENAADVVFDTVGDSMIYKVAKPQGSVVSVAMLPDGNALEHFRQKDVPLSLFGGFKFALAKRIVSLAGWVATRGFRSKGQRYSYVVMEPNGQMLESVFNPLLESEQLKPAIANVYRFDRKGVQDAFKESRDGHAAGKIIICVRD
ncbi:hypothetical protein GGI07_001732 [Coemansia sp. Benny D115]|nr:hypothetical protein GGI07_001732 [Coemansia sp. Benny D115]